MRLELPTPIECFDLAMEDGATIRVRRHGNADGARMFLSHGNGFAADAYLPFWGPLATRFELIIFDFRNHGHNPPSDAANHNYAQMSRDLERIFEGVTGRLGAKTNIGAFHSMSGRAAMKHAIEIGWRWDALFLFDPPNIPLAGHPLHQPLMDFELKLIAWASQRQDRFKDTGELAQQYAALRSHKNWVEGAHDLMARSVLHREVETGDWVLSCRRELEASIYRQALTLNLWPRYDEFGGPVKLIGADPSIKNPSPTAAANFALHQENGYPFEAIAGSGHMLQLERPAECRKAVTSYLRELGIDF
ncbi:MAG: alpha/beta hydrolase [Alphaproteobacteria bacterium]